MKQRQCLFTNVLCLALAGPILAQQPKAAHSPAEGIDMFHKSHQGRVMDPDGERLNGVEVQLIHPLGSEVESNANGYYTFDPLPSGLDMHNPYRLRFFKKGFAVVDTAVFLANSFTLVMKPSREICIQVFGDAARTQLLRKIPAASSRPNVKCPPSDDFGYIRVVVPPSIGDQEVLRITFMGQPAYADIPKEMPVKDWLARPVDVVLLRTGAAPVKPAATPPPTGSGAPGGFEAERVSLYEIRKGLVANPGNQALVEAFIQQFQRVDGLRLSPAERRAWQEERPFYLKIKDYLVNAVGPGSPCQEAWTQREQVVKKHDKVYALSLNPPTREESVRLNDEICDIRLQIIDHGLNAAHACQQADYQAQVRQDMADLRNDLLAEKQALEMMAGQDPDFYEQRIRANAQYFDLLALRARRL